jgi:hypothetical protein
MQQRLLRMHQTGPQREARVSDSCSEFARNHLTLNLVLSTKRAIAILFNAPKRYFYIT